MALDTARFVALLFVVLNLMPAAAHVLELPNKMQLSHADYMLVQQIYRGWALAGIVVLGAIISTAVLAILVRQRPESFAFTLVALLCLVGAQAVFWLLTYPVNQETMNWTATPGDWTVLRNTWEYSHAAGAVLDFIAFVALALSMLTRDDR